MQRERDLIFTLGFDKASNVMILSKKTLKLDQFVVLDFWINEREKVKLLK